MTEARLLAVPRTCPDCTASPVTIPPLKGFSAAVLTVHDATCPLLGSLITRR